MPARFGSSPPQDILTVSAASLAGRLPHPPPEARRLVRSTRIEARHRVTRQAFSEKEAV